MNQLLPSELINYQNTCKLAEKFIMWKTLILINMEKKLSLCSILYDYSAIWIWRVEIKENTKAVHSKSLIGCCEHVSFCSPHVSGESHTVCIVFPFQRLYQPIGLWFNILNHLWVTQRDHSQGLLKRQKAKTTWACSCTIHDFTHLVHFSLTFYSASSCHLPKPTD